MQDYTPELKILTRPEQLVNWNIVVGPRCSRVLLWKNYEVVDSEMRLSKVICINQYVIRGNFSNQEKARIASPTFKTLQVLLSPPYLNIGLQVPEKSSNPDVYNALITHQNTSWWVCAQLSFSLWKSGEPAWDEIWKVILFWICKKKPFILCFSICTAWKSQQTPTECMET